MQIKMQLKNKNINSDKLLNDELIVKISGRTGVLN